MMMMTMTARTSLAARVCTRNHYFVTRARSPWDLTGIDDTYYTFGGGDNESTTVKFLTRVFYMFFFCFFLFVLFYVSCLYAVYSRVIVYSVTISLRKAVFLQFLWRNLTFRCRRRRRRSRPNSEWWLTRADVIGRNDYLRIGRVMLIEILRRSRRRLITRVPDEQPPLLLHEPLSNIGETLNPLEYFNYF